jgi:hypothetical protein
MANDPLPIVYTGTSRSRLIAVAVGVLLTVLGIMLIFDSDGDRVVGVNGFGLGGPGRSDLGWMMTGLGLVIAIGALMSLVHGCPRLELNSEGISYSRCLQGTTRIAWNELDRAEIQRVRRRQPIGEIKLDYVLLVTTDGQKVVISAPIDPDQVENVQAAITRVAASFRATGNTS